MIPVVCIVGTKKSGKTTLIEKLIPQLTQRGYKVGTIKHDVDEFSIDHEGKDTWRHGKAGSRTVVISSPIQLAMIKTMSQEMILEEIVQRFFWEEDIILTEGYKNSPFPKIEVFSKEKNQAPMCTSEANLVAVYGDKPEETKITYFPWNEVEKVANFLEEHYLKSRKLRHVSIIADGKNIPMNDFVETIIGNTIEGLLKSLRGWHDSSHVIITMRKKRSENSDSNE